MLVKILVAEYKVHEEFAGECSYLIVQNGRFIGIIHNPRFKTL